MPFSSLRTVAALLAATLPHGAAQGADLAGQVFRIEYTEAGAEDCLRFLADGRFAADSSLLLPAGRWEQSGATYTAYQSDSSGNTFTWGGLAVAANPGGDRLVGAFVSSFPVRLGFTGSADPECEVDFEGLEAIASPSPMALDGGASHYRVLSLGVGTVDCWTFDADGTFRSGVLVDVGLPAGGWHRSGATIAAYQSGEVDEGFSVNTVGALQLDGGDLLVAVGSDGERVFARRDDTCF